MEKEYKISFIKVMLFIVIVFVIVSIIWVLIPKKSNTSNGYLSNYINNINLMKEAGFEYFQGTNLPEKIGTSKEITLQEMIDSKLLVEFYDENNKVCDTKNSYIKTTKQLDNEYAMKVYLSCDDKEDYIVTTISNDLIACLDCGTTTNTTNQTDNSNNTKDGTYSGDYITPSTNDNSINNSYNNTTNNYTSPSTTETYPSNNNRGGTYITNYNINYVNNCGCPNNTPNCNSCTSNVLYSVYFETNGGSYVPRQVVRQGDVALYATTYKDGYEFLGWYKDSSLTTKFDFNTPITAPTTLYAKWRKINTRLEYVVDFDSNGGSSVDSQEVLDGNEVTRPSDPTRKCYRFLGWYLNGIKYDFSNPVKGNITLVAKWEDDGSCHTKTNYNITYDSNGGSSVAPDTVEEGNWAKRPANPTRPCYQFVAWHLNSLSGSIYNFNTPVYGDIHLVAEWADDGSCHKTYQATFDSNGGNYISPQTINEGGYVSRPSNPTKSCYQFVAWHLNSLSGAVYNFNTPVYGDKHLVAEWVDDGSCHKSYQATFDSNGGSYVSPQTINEGGYVSKPSTPTRACYKFVAWHLNSLSGAVYNFNTKVYSDKHLVAEWADDGSCHKTYQATFDSNGGSYISPQTINEGGYVSKPSTPTRACYKFVAWHLNSLSGAVYNFNTKVYSDKHLVAEWTDDGSCHKTYKVTFNSNGGSYVASQTVDEGNYVSRPSNPTRSGYRFLGWYYNNSEFNFNTRIYQDYTLVAKWEKEQVLYSKYCKKEQERHYSISWVQANTNSSVDWTIQFTKNYNTNNLKVTNYGYLSSSNDYELAATYYRNKEIAKAGSNNGYYVDFVNGATLKNYSLKSSNFTPVVYTPYKTGSTWYLRAYYKYNTNGVTPYYASNIKANINFVPFYFDISYTDLNNCITDLASNSYKYSNYEIVESFYK